MDPFTEKAAVRLKAVNPVVADEDNVVRQRSAVHRNRQQQSRKSIVETFATLTRRRVKSQSLVKLDARRRKNIDGRKAAFGRRRF